VAKDPQWFGTTTTSGGGGTDWFADTPTTVAPTSSGGGHHSILDTLGHVLYQAPVDLKNMAYGIPGGLYQLHLAVNALDPLNPRHVGHSDPSRVEALGKGYVKAVKQEGRHPLRNPGNTVVDLVLPILSGGASTALRVTNAARVAEEAGTAGEVARAALRNPSKGKVRTVTAPSGLSAKGHYSRSGLGYATQKATDAGLQKLAARGGAPGRGGKAETLLNKRIDKWTNRQLRTEQAVLDSKVTKLAVATRNLTPVESRALRMAFEKVPISERLAADTQRVQEAEGRVGQVPGADRRTVKRLQDREQWGRDALQHLDIAPDDTATIKLDGPEGERLHRILGLMGEVYTDRESILKALDIMDEEALNAAKTKVGRYTLGAHWVNPTAARLGHSPGIRAQRRQLASITRRFDKLYDREQPGSIVTHDRVLNRKAAVQHLAELTLAHDNALKDFANAHFGPVDMAEVRYRNRENARARLQAAGVTKSGRRSGSRGRKSVLRPTVWKERYDEAQRLIDEQIAADPNHPVSKLWQARQDEIDRLTEALTPSIEDVFGPEPGATASTGKREPIKVSERRVKGTSIKLERLGAAGSVMKDELARAEKRARHYVRPVGVVGAEHLQLPPEAGFIGYPRRASVIPPKIKVSSSGTLGHTRDASFRPSMGETIRYGLDEPNVGKILASRGHAANKLKMLARRVDLARKGGTSVPTRADDVFVWNDDQIISQAKIPPDVKDYLADPDKFDSTPGAEQSIIDQARGAWVKPDWKLDPDSEEILKAAAEGKGVFVHRAALGDLAKPLPSRIEGKLGTIADVTNNIQKSLLIYLKVNYPIVQALSNTAMNFIQQGPAAPVNIARAGHLMSNDPELAGQLGEIMGTGALMQLAGDEGKGSRAARVTASATQRLAHWMSGYVDGPARLSAIIHEAGKEGFKSRAQLKALIEDPQHAEKLGEIAQRAKEAIVDYGEMSMTEKALIRRLFFVYPWLKGSTKYVGHFLRDHPIQASVLSQFAHSGQRENADFNAMLPSYLQGSFLSHTGGGGLINPSGVNPLQTPASIAEALAGLATGNPTAPEGAQFLTPALATAIGLATGRNTLGIPLKGTGPARLRQILIDPTYAAQLARAGARSAGLTEGKDDATANIIRSLLGSKTASKTFPDPNDPYWRFLFGGLYPRGYDEGALRRAKALESSGR
jgi:hypothetical protein